ncbi:hypothetical protein [Methanocella conradii]|uniref:hypothetical protein n=1 Tax=Methanocella conradii TaxID=1175444 RepID=UPI0024B379A9|nr:hypothetical protein [Methanocella conradii]MDI6897074.1 hypothetical protein [Methanocella conradii]
MSSGWGFDGYCLVKTKKIFSIKDNDFKYAYCDDFVYAEPDKQSYACFLQYVFDKRIEIIMENNDDINITIERIAKTIAYYIKTTLPIYQNITYTCAIQSIKRKIGNTYREEIDDKVKQMLAANDIEMPIELGKKITHANVFKVIKSMK